MSSKDAEETREDVDDGKEERKSEDGDSHFLDQSCDSVERMVLFWVIRSFLVAFFPYRTVVRSVVIFQRRPFLAAFVLSGIRS